MDIKPITEIIKQLMRENYSITIRPESAEQLLAVRITISHDHQHASYVLEPEILDRMNFTAEEYLCRMLINLMDTIVRAPYTTILDEHFGGVS